MRFLLLPFVFLSILPARAQVYDYEAARGVWEGRISHSASGALSAELQVRYRIRYRHFFGEPIRSIVADAEIGPTLRFGGETYALADLPSDVRRQIRFINADIAYDIYRGQSRVSTVRHSNVGNLDMDGSPDWDEVFPGVSESNAKDLFRSGFSIRNVRLTDVSLGGESALRSYVREQAREAERQRDEREREERQREEAERAEAERQFDEQRRTDDPGTATLESSAVSDGSAPASPLASLSSSQRSRYQSALSTARQHEQARDVDAAILYYRIAYDIAPSESLASRIQSLERAEVEREAVQQVRMEDNTEKMMAEAVTLVQGGWAAGLSLYGDELGILMGNVSSRGAYMFSMGTNDPVSMLDGDATDSSVDEISLWVGADIGISFTRGSALMPFVGGHYYTKGDEGYFSVGWGATGHLFNTLVYQVGGRTPVSGTARSITTEPFLSLGIQIGSF